MIIAYQQTRGAPSLQQDSLLVGETVYQGNAVAGRVSAGEGYIVGVADGMASAPMSEWMSYRLLEEISGAYRQDGLAFNARLIRRAQTALTPDVKARRLRHASASTVVLAELRDGTLTVLNTGDSRAYLINRVTGQFRRLSKDHTTFQLLKDSGELPADAQDCDYGSVAMGLLEAVTAAPMAEQDFAVHMDYTRPRENQVVLLCSDGVTAHLRDTEIAEQVVEAHRLGQNPCARVVDLVLERGASDNTTVIVVQPDGEGSEKEGAF